MLILGGKEGMLRVLYQEKVLVKPAEVDVTIGYPNWLGGQSSETSFLGCLH